MVTGPQRFNRHRLQPIPLAQLAPLAQLGIPLLAQLAVRLSRVVLPLAVRLSPQAMLLLVVQLAVQLVARRQARLWAPHNLAIQVAPIRHGQLAAVVVQLAVVAAC